MAERNCPGGLVKHNVAVNARPRQAVGRVNLAGPYPELQDRRAHGAAIAQVFHQNRCRCADLPTSMRNASGSPQTRSAGRSLGETFFGAAPASPFTLTPLNHSACQKADHAWQTTREFSMAQGTAHLRLSPRRRMKRPARFASSTAGGRAMRRTSAFFDMTIGTSSR